MKKIPFAYFITFTCYGHGLHGQAKGSVDRFNNKYDEPFLPANNARFNYVLNKMKGPSVLLSHTHRETVLNTIIKVCEHKKWKLFAAHVRTNHIHVLLRALTTPSNVLHALKSYSTRAIKSQLWDEEVTKLWTRGGSARHIWKGERCIPTAYYIVYEQGYPMSYYIDPDLKEELGNPGFTFADRKK